MKPRVVMALLVAILAASFVVKLNHLDHPAIKPLDEVFHAIVARNYLKHPLTPTLVDQAFLPEGTGDWLDSHIWLHKPPMALWQIAISDAVLGVTPLALRLPSAILSTLAALWTYLIGAKLFDRTAGLVAAGLQAFNPVILMIVNGYVFSDHVDISLLFWTELSILFLVMALQGGAKRDALLCGVAQGLAFLSKTYPALIVTGLAVLFWMVGFYLRRGAGGSDVDSSGLRTERSHPKSPPQPSRNPSHHPILRKLPQDRERVLEGFGDRVHPLSGENLLWILIATLVIAAPWNISMAVRFPNEFAVENVRILHHLTENVENWAAPWDQIVFNYWISVFHVFYVAVIVATVVTVIDLKRWRSLNLFFVLAWAVGAAAPHLLATSKTMTATLIGWPAGWLMIGYLISKAMKGDRLALGAWLASLVCAALLLDKTSIPRGGEHWGDLPPGFGGIMREHLWVIWQAGISLAVGFAFLLAPINYRKPKKSANDQSEASRRLAGFSIIAMLAAALSLFLTIRFWKGNHPLGYAYVAWEVTQTNAREPDFAQLSLFAAHLPANAAFLVEERTPLENKLVEFAADRSCYPTTEENYRQLAQSLRKAGAIPFLITSETVPLPVAFADVDEGVTVYPLLTQDEHGGKDAAGNPDPADR